MKKLFILALLLFASTAFAVPHFPVWNHRGSADCNINDLGTNYEYLRWCGAMEGTTGIQLPQHSYGYYGDMGNGMVTKWGDNAPSEYFIKYLTSDLEGKTAGGVDDLSVKYIIESQPIFRFNVPKDNGTLVSDVDAPQRWQFMLDDDSNVFLDPIIDYESTTFTGNVDHPYDYTYQLGVTETAPSEWTDDYSTENTYYWCTRACDAVCGGGGDSMWLCSRGGINNVAAAESGFKKAEYFNKAHDANMEYEVLSGVTTTSAKISVLTPHVIDYKLVWSEESDLTPETGNVEGSDVTGAIQAEMTGLSPDTTYYFQFQFRKGTSVAAHSTTLTKVKSFKTLVEAGTSWRLGLSTDLHTFNVNGHDQTEYEAEIDSIGDFMLGQDVDVWLDGGDFEFIDQLAVYNQDTANALYSRKHKGISKATTDATDKIIPIGFAMGNHEGGLGYMASIPWSTTNFKYDNYTQNSLSFGMPWVLAKLAIFPEWNNAGAGNTWYSFENGDALVLVLDPYVDSPTYGQECEDIFTYGVEQTAWIKSKIADSDKRWILILTHQHGGGHIQQANRFGYWNLAYSEPSTCSNLFGATDKTECTQCYGQGGADELENSATYGELWSSFAKDRNIIVFLGHAHTYAYSKHRNVHFVTLPSHTENFNLGETIEGYYKDPLYPYVYDVRQTYEESGGFWGTIETLGSNWDNNGILVYDEDTAGGSAETILAANNLVLNATKGFIGLIDDYNTTADTLTVSRNYYTAMDSSWMASGYNPPPDPVSTEVPLWEVGDKIVVADQPEGNVIVDITPSHVRVRALKTNGDPFPDPEYGVFSNYFTDIKIYSYFGFENWE